MNLFDYARPVFGWLKTAGSLLNRQNKHDQCASTLVLTSLNPRIKMDHQLRCFNEWSEIGYDVCSFNSEEEYAQLVNAGLSTKQLQKMSKEQTAAHLFNKPIPRILPVLEYALRTDYDFFILTNSDIFPAHNKVVSSHLANFSESIAFTRAECPDLSINTFMPKEYYRGGLDVFWFTKQRLQFVFNMLKNTSVSQRMTFGVPGWDFFLGHIICKDLDSPIMDGSIFVHQSHENTYTNFDEFGYYSPEMENSGHYTSEGFVQLAREFHLFIVQQCATNEDKANHLKLKFYKKPIVRNYA